MTSILHRLSGFLLFLLLPVLLVLLEKSLSSAEGFNRVAHLFSCPIAKGVAWLMCVGMIYHIVAGVRHLVMDAGYGEGLKSGRIGSWIVIITSVVLSLIVGGWML